MTDYIVQEITKCTNCKCKYKTTEENFELYFGFKKGEEPFKTCRKCRNKGKPKIKCDRCLLDVMEDEIKEHRSSVYCRETHYAAQKKICEFCSEFKVNCWRCKWWYYDAPKEVLRFNEKYQNEEGIKYIKDQLRKEKPYKPYNPDDEDINNL